MYTKPRGKAVDLTDPLVVRGDATIEDVVSPAETAETVERISDQLARAVQLHPSFHRFQIQVSEADHPGTTTC